MVPLVILPFQTLVSLFVHFSPISRIRNDEGGVCLLIDPGLQNSMFIVLKGRERFSHPRSIYIKDCGSRWTLLENYCSQRDNIMTGSLPNPYGLQEAMLVWHKQQILLQGPCIETAPCSETSFILFRLSCSFLDISNIFFPTHSFPSNCIKPIVLH